MFHIFSIFFCQRESKYVERSAYVPSLSLRDSFSVAFFFFFFFFFLIKETKSNSLFD